MGGFGASGSGGQGFAIRLEADGDTKLGNSDGDLHQVTGTLQLNENVFVLANGRLGIGTDAPDYKLDVAGNIGINQHIYHNGDANTKINFTDDRVQIEAGGLALIGAHKKASAPHQVTINNGSNNVDFVVKDNDNNQIISTDASTSRLGILTDAPSVTLDVAGDVNFDGGAVFNESSADKDFRVESNNADHMFFIDGSSNRIGVGTSGPQHTIDIQERTGVEAVIRLQGTADVGIRLAADSDNSGENDNPYIDWYQDGQNSNSRANRLSTIAMEGDASNTFTGSIANALFLSTFCPNAQSSSLRPFQIATDSSNNGFRNRLTIEGANGHIGIGKNNPDVELDVNGEIRGTVVSSSAGATFLGDVITKDIKASGSITVAGTAITSTPAELNLLDASVTSEASDGVWAVVERVAKITVDSNDYARSAGPVSLGVTIPDNAILTKYVFDCTQTFAAGDDGSEAMAVVDLGLYNASGKVFDFASQANIERTGATSAPYVAAVSEVSPLAAASTKLTEALTAKIHVFDDGSGMLNSLDAGALDIYVYYIIGA